MIRTASLASCVLCVVLVSQCSAQVDFARDVQPILAEHCYACHGADEAESGLRLDRPESATQAADSGDVAVVPHDVAASALVHRIQSDDPDQRMPPEGDPLSQRDVEQLKRWITEGAAWTTHWAYRPLVVGPPPNVPSTAWVRSPIDHYVLARLEHESILPSPAATKEKLIRRLSYDLLGLPPSVELVDRFIQDRSPNAYEQIVDEMLASPRFGERWGRHWLDKARYADSDGYEKDNNRPRAWRYRDWVIDAINADMPFDQFTIEQLAGDLLPGTSDDQILATAFHRQTLTNTEGGTDQEQWRVAAVMDRTETLGAVWLGLTIGCARCHSHKYDPISQAEYYQLYACFNNADETNYGLPPTPEQQSDYLSQLREHQKNLAAKRSQLATLKSQQEFNEAGNEAGNDAGNEAGNEAGNDAGNDAAISAAQETKTKTISELEKELEKLETSPPTRPQFTVRVVSRRNQDRRTTHILRRGEFKQPLDEVRAGTLSIVPTAHRDDALDERLQLAHWLVDGNNPLVPRVVANHVWQRLFGAGLVSTLNDFGVRGEAPSHPQLLDYLAREYIRLGWSRKALVRQIVLSATYRQSSNHRPELVDLDPNNRLLYRQNRFRLEAESLRDVTLAVAGLLSARIGGPSVFPPMPAEAAAVSYANNFKWKTSPGEDRYRRGMYTYFKRTAPHPTLTTFDCPDANVTNVQRNRSNTPIGALVLLNNEVYSESAVSFAKHVVRLSDDDAQRVTHAFRTCMARTPNDQERQQLLAMLQASREYFTANSEAASQLVGSTTQGHPNIPEWASWTATLRVLLNLDEFITRD